MGDHVQRALTLTSPISWMRIADLGVTRFGIKMGLSYVLVVCSFLAVTILLMMFIYYRIGKIDFIWNKFMEQDVCLAIKDASKKFGDHQILMHVNLICRKGEIAGIIGRTIKWARYRRQRRNSELAF